MKYINKIHNKNRSIYQLLKCFLKSQHEGFTWMELLVVLFIICVLAAVALPNLLGCVGRRHEGAIAIQTINREQRKYYNKEGKFASSLEELGISSLQQEAEYSDYSIEVTPTVAYAFSTPRKLDDNEENQSSDNTKPSYTGALFLLPTPDNTFKYNQQKPMYLAISCLGERERGIKPNKSIIKDGLINCGKDMRLDTEINEVEILVEKFLIAQSYVQKDYYQKNGKFASNLKELGLSSLKNELPYYDYSIEVTKDATYFFATLKNPPKYVTTSYVGILYLMPVNDNGDKKIDVLFTLCGGNEIQENSNNTLLNEESICPENMYETRISREIKNIKNYDTL